MEFNVYLTISCNEEYIHVYFQLPLEFSLGFYRQWDSFLIILQHNTINWLGHCLIDGWQKAQLGESC